MDPVTPFEWERLLFGVQPPLYLLEIILRIVVIYLFGVFYLRVGGKRDLHPLTAFDLLIIIALGSAVGDSLFYPEVPIAYGIVVTAVVLTLHRVVSLLQARSPRAHDFIAGQARLVIRDGRILDDAVRKEVLARDELLSLLREHGVRNTGEVERAYLELSGQLGILRFPNGMHREGESTLPQQGSEPAPPGRKN